jgi:cytochrome P450/NADPH-cytochrome P450 reductase
LVGNLYDINPESPIPSFVGLIQRYGEIIALDVLGRHIVLVGSQKLVHELCDQTRFEKVVKGALAEVRHVAGDGESSVYSPADHSGLFTAHGDEESWAIARRILVPAFGPLSIRNMMPGMQDIASQLIQKVNSTTNRG